MKSFYSTRPLLFAALLSIGLSSFLASGCGGGGGASSSSGGSGGGGGSTESLALTLSNATLTVPQGGSIGRVTVNVARTNTTSSVSLTVSGLPSGATSTVELQPGTAAAGTVAINPDAAVQGTYPVSISASDGTATASTSLSLVINGGTASQLATPITWSLSGMIVGPVPDATHPINAVKDPTAFYYNNQWNVYATDVDTNGYYNMEYVHFADWSNAPSATPYYMDQTSGLSGYHCAPTVFYFTPQKKWYLIYQSGPPQYSTADDPTQPQTWTAPQSFYSAQPSTVTNWLDFTVICDSANCYLIFAGDNGIIYRASTTIANFPQGFGTPLPIMQADNAQDLFESVKVYSLKGMNQYLMIVEAGQDQNWTRYFRGFILPTLDGSVTPLPEGSSWAAPFAGENNVSFASGVTPWTNDISHGDIVRTNPDETQTIDPSNLQFLIQGDQPNNGAANYNLIPWRLGLLTRTN